VRSIEAFAAQQGADHAGVLCGVGWVEDGSRILGGEAATARPGDRRAGAVPAALAASPLRSEAANAAEEELVFFMLIKVRFLSPPHSNC